MDITDLVNSWNWGDVPTWLASVLTSASLLLALMLLASDRRTRARELADQFITWPEIIHDLTNDRWLVRVNWANAGAMPILRPSVTQRLGGKLVGRGHLGEREGVTAVVAPGVSDGRPLTPFEREPPVLYVEFTDGRGHRWSRDLSTGDYISTLTIRRWTNRSEYLTRRTERVRR
jgi:hypothetical protein